MNDSGQSEHGIHRGDAETRRRGETRGERERGVRRRCVRGGFLGRPRVGPWRALPEIEWRAEEAEAAEKCRLAQGAGVWPYCWCQLIPLSRKIGVDWSVFRMDE